MYYAVAEWYGAGLATVRPAPTTAVYQCQLSMPSLRGRLRCTGPVSVVLRLRLVSGWGLWNGDQRCPMGLKKARERTLLYFLPARRYASAGNSDCSMSVCPSVRLSRAGIVSKRRKL